MKDAQVKILGVKKECSVKNVTVYRGFTVKFSSPDSDAKISFPDSPFENSNNCWETISKGENIEKTVASSADGTYYYAVMCKDDDEIYWYAEGNSCPSMIVGG